MAIFRDTADVEKNIWAGLLCCCFFFLIVSVLAYPNGPFTRPHPAVWRIVFGLSVLYLLGCLFILFQNTQTVNGILYWLDPSLKVSTFSRPKSAHVLTLLIFQDFHIDMDKEYGVNCSDLSVERIWSHVDVFALGHFFGWMFKAILIRHMGILWATRYNNTYKRMNKFIYFRVN